MLQSEISMSEGGSARIPGWRIAAWHVLRALSFFLVKGLYGYRAWERRRVPRRGPVLFVANHQSFWDPVLAGLAIGRPFYAVARRTLFDNPGLAGLMRLLNALPLDQERPDPRSLRAAVKVLQSGESLLLFPEGARTPDGAVHSFERGMELVLRRARPLVVPLGIAGADRAWPRGRAFFRALVPLGVVCGEPVEAEALLAAPEGASEALRRRVGALHEEAARRLGRGEAMGYSRGLPGAGPGDGSGRVNGAEAPARPPRTQQSGQPS
jgi:1-acyl-sn-glycerol-3-phosphate acyltransferase